MKRTNEEVTEQRNSNDVDFTLLEEKVVTHIENAVVSATREASDQPIIFHVIAEDDCDNQAIAYWPASEAVGNWLLKTLVVLCETDIERQISLIEPLCFEPATAKEIYKGLYNDKITKIADLGTFKKLQFRDLKKKEEGYKKCRVDNEVKFQVCDRNELNTFLFTVELMCYC